MRREDIPLRAARRAWAVSRAASAMLGLLALGLLSRVAVPGPAQAADAAQASPPATSAPGGGSGVQAASRCDGACVRANTERAVQACAPRIEAEAATDFDWILRPLPGIFQRAEQASAQDAVVRYRGDSIRFQTPNREWTRVSYECGFDADAKRVVFVNVRPGRLDHPQPASQAMAAPPRPAPQVAVRPLAPPARPVAQAATAQPDRRPPAKKPPGPVAVGEPSPIEILQQTPRVR